MIHQETYPSNEEDSPRYTIQTNNKYAVLTDITNAMDTETANSENFVTYLRNKNREKSHATKDKDNRQQQDVSSKRTHKAAKKMLLTRREGRKKNRAQEKA